MKFRNKISYKSTSSKNTTDSFNEFNQNHRKIISIRNHAKLLILLYFSRKKYNLIEILILMLIEFTQNKYNAVVFSSLI